MVYMHYQLQNVHKLWVKRDNTYKVILNADWILSLGLRINVKTNNNYESENSCIDKMS